MMLPLNPPTTTTTHNGGLREGMAAVPYATIGTTWQLSPTPNLGGRGKNPMTFFAISDQLLHYENQQYIP
ncbi:MAG: hypothetical protein GX797_06825 [Chloroflexi bacterium]|nr:hypothetical protein [Chloroflexota bacterium]